MTHFLFLQEPPEGYTVGFEPWLFHDDKHLTIQSPLPWKRFYIVCPSQNKIVGRISFLIEKKEAMSPHKAPFGSLQCVEALPVKVIFDFLEYVMGQLETAGVKKILIKNHPENYAPAFSAVLSTCLINLGFHVESELGMYLNVSGLFENNLNTWQSRKLRQSSHHGLVFRKLKLNEAEHIHSFILACRQERNYNLSIDLDTLLKTCEVFPDRFYLFSVYDNEKLCAASISIDVGNRILYNFISAHPRDYDSMSPVVILMKGMYNFCLDANFKQLDLGTSALFGKPNFSLLDFKMGLGGIPASKFTFSKDL